MKYVMPLPMKLARKETVIIYAADLISCAKENLLECKKACIVKVA